jgi:glycosyltransferase involved in cell wall biosynthesis
MQRSAIHVVVSGANGCGLPAALAGRRYLVWIGTLYRDELEGKAAVGDDWARHTLRGFGGELLDWEERFIFERAAGILTNGPHTAEAVRRRYPQVKDKVRVMIYPVDTETFRPDPAVRAAVRRPYLLFTARINDPRKNVGLLLEAFARARAARPELELVLTGNDPLASIREKVAALGLGEAVRFVGYQTPAELVLLYQGAELFVLSSTQEGLGISLLEAMACGLPAVSTRCGGPEGVLAEGHTGLLVDNGDAEAFAGAVLGLLGDPARLEAMRANCAEYARAHFARPLIEDRLLDAFRATYPEHF